MAWKYNPGSWTTGYSPTVTDFQNIAADIATAGGNRDSGSYGLPNASFLTLIPGALPGTSYTVTGASWATGTATITIGTHVIQVGQHFSLASVNPSGYNGSDLVATGVTGTTVSYARAVNPGAWSSGGTVLVGGLSAANGMTAVDQNGVQWLNVSGVWVLASQYAPDTLITLANGVNDNINIGGASSIRITGPTAAFSLGGFTGGYGGRILYVINDSIAFAMTVKNASSGSSTGNKIATLTNADVSIGTSFGGTATFKYDDGSINSWILIGHQP